MLDAMDAAEREPGVRSVSVFHGFAWSDHPEVGAGVLIVADPDAPDTRALADGLARQFAAACDAFLAANPLRDTDAALAHALCLADGPGTGPVVVADRGDNPGAGGAGDTTWLLHALHQRAVAGAALAMLHDTDAVAQAHRLGTGAQGAFRLGGRHALSGPPFEATMRVLACRSDVRQRAFGTGPWDPIGASAALQVVTPGHGAGPVVIVSTRRTQVFSRHVFSAHGIDPLAQRVLVVKSTSHFLADFAPLAREVVFCDPPGPTGEDLRPLGLRRVPRPLWPLDDLPLPLRSRPR
jgi:microcystin degradation protein MlrC